MDIRGTVSHIIQPDLNRALTARLCHRHMLEYYNGYARLWSSEGATSNIRASNWFQMEARRTDREGTKTDHA
jgi:hypothetical protein